MVEQREYRVRSSDGQSSYVVGFWWDGEHLYVKCSCRAGIVGQGCRHKDAILAGDTSVLFEDADIREIAEWIERSAVGFALRRVNEAERLADRANAELRSAKKDLAALIRPDDVLKLWGE